MVFISASANLYPMQFRCPPKKVRILPYTPGTALRWAASSAGTSLLAKWRSGLNSSASGPQMSFEVLRQLMARCQVR
jgi:hypothetical protein